MGRASGGTPGDGSPRPSPTTRCVGGWAWPSDNSQTLAPDPSRGDILLACGKLLVEPGFFAVCFDAVQRNLIRKGVLVVAEARTNSPTKTKMELWRYRFPPEFGPFLPPLVHPGVRSD